LKLLPEVVNSVAIASATAAATTAECFGRGGTSIAAAGDRLVCGTGEHACHLFLDAEKRLLLPKYILPQSRFSFQLAIRIKTIHF
jgi:hypothetical protein